MKIQTNQPLPRKANFKTVIVINKANAKQAAAVVRTINHEIRQKIIVLLLQHGELSVTKIYSKMRLEQSVTSGHLRLLRNVGVVKVTQVGKERLYSAVESRIVEINGLLEALAKS